MIDLNLCNLPSGKIINFPAECPIISVGAVYTITEQNADLLNIKFADGTIGNYYFAINYVNGVGLPLVYSSVRKANIDRNFMVKWLKNHDSKL